MSFLKTIYERMQQPSVTTTPSRESGHSDAPQSNSLLQAMFSRYSLSSFPDSQATETAPDTRQTTDDISESVRDIFRGGDSPPESAPILEAQVPRVDQQMSETSATTVDPRLLGENRLSGPVANKMKHIRKFDEDGSEKQDKLVTQLKVNHPTVPREGSDDSTLGKPSPGHEVSSDLVLKGEYLTQPDVQQTNETTLARLSPDGYAMLGHNQPMTRRSKRKTKFQDGDPVESMTTQKLGIMSVEDQLTTGIVPPPNANHHSPSDACQSLTIKEERKVTKDKTQHIHSDIVSLTDEDRGLLGMKYDVPFVERIKHVTTGTQDKHTTKLEPMSDKQHRELGRPTESRLLPPSRELENDEKAELMLKSETLNRKGDDTGVQQRYTSMLRNDPSVGPLPRIEDCSTKIKWENGRPVSDNTECDLRFLTSVEEMKYGYTNPEGRGKEGAKKLD